jgi:hypothetical protein
MPLLIPSPCSLFTFDFVDVKETIGPATITYRYSGHGENGYVLLGGNSAFPEVTEYGSCTEQATPVPVSPDDFNFESGGVYVVDGDGVLSARMVLHEVANNCTEEPVAFINLEYDYFDCGTLL